MKLSHSRENCGKFPLTKPPFTVYENNVGRNDLKSWRRNHYWCFDCVGSSPCGPVHMYMFVCMLSCECGLRVDGRIKMRRTGQKLSDTTLKNVTGTRLV